MLRVRSLKKEEEEERKKKEITVSAWQRGGREGPRVEKIAILVKSSS